MHVSDRQTDKKIGRQRDRQTERQTDRQTRRHLQTHKIVSVAGVALFCGFIGFSLLLLLRLSMTPNLMSILPGLLGKLSLSLALLVALLLAGLLLTTLQLLSGLDGTGTAGSVAPCAAGGDKGLHVVQEKRQALHGEMDFVR